MYLVQEWNATGWMTVGKFRTREAAQNHINVGVAWTPNYYQIVKVS